MKSRIAPTQTITVELDKCIVKELERIALYEERTLSRQLNLIAKHYIDRYRPVNLFLVPNADD